MKIKFHHCDFVDRPDYKVRKKNVVTEFLSSESVVEDGVEIRRSVFKVDDPSMRFKGLACFDYSLQNLLAAGVNLKMSYCVPQNFQAVENASVAASRLSDYVKSLNSENNG